MQKCLCIERNFSAGHRAVPPAASGTFVIGVMRTRRAVKTPESCCGLMKDVHS